MSPPPRPGAAVPHEAPPPEGPPNRRSEAPSADRAGGALLRNRAGGATLTDRARRWSNSLSLRLAVLTTVALVPLGVIAVIQTVQLQRELDRVRALNLQVVTTDIARQEGEAIDTAFGAGSALAATYFASDPVPSTCVPDLQRLARRYGEQIGFMGFVPVDGLVTCATIGAPRDFSNDSVFEQRMARRAPFVTASPQGHISGVAVVTTHTPVYSAEGAFRGLITISMIDRGPLSRSQEVPGTESVDYVFFDADGAVLATSEGVDRPDDVLPRDMEFDALRTLRAGPLTAADGNGDMRRYAIAEAVDGVVYVVGSQRIDGTKGLARAIAPEAFPLIMWLASLILIFSVLEASLVGPVRGIAARMRRFGETRRLATAPARRPLPPELQAIETSFAETAERLMREEAELTDAVYDRDVLLKEVFHRVKNNLQMISSMINLQIREVNEPETEAALEKVGGRIASLAAVHRHVYDSDRPGAVRADSLLREVVVPLSDTILSEFPAAQRPDLRLDLDTVRLTPDQAVPAAMLVVEALTTVLRWTASSPPADRWVEVALSADLTDGATEADVTLRIAGTPDRAVSEGDGTGTVTLGERLIRGFARQLRGTLSLDRESEITCVAVTFRALPFSPDDAPEEDTDDDAPEGRGVP